MGAVRCLMQMCTIRTELIYLLRDWILKSFTPGHTAGGSCYYIAEAGILFSGDTLFAASVGRTDFPTGSMSAIVRSIKGKILVLPDDTKVFPGHGESTSVAYEKKYNPFLQ